jgi:GMP synthase (glutamine-hydrolysing)
VSTLPVLVVEHEAQCPPGWLGEWLVDAGTPVDVRRPYAGDVLPPDLTSHSGMLVLGGEMGAYDDEAHPWLAEVKALVRAAVDDGTAVLGVCLGHQLAAVALGGEVAPAPLGQQIGVLTVGWTDAAYDDRLLGPMAARHESPAVQWNNDIVTRLPTGAVDLAHTPHGELQAARFAPSVWGVQWHPEAGEEIIGPWADHDRDDAVERGVDVDAYVAEVAGARDRLRATWRLLADAFAAVCRESVEVSHR